MSRGTSPRDANQNPRLKIMKKELVYYIICAICPVIPVMRWFEKRRLKKNIREWIGLAIKNGPNSGEAYYVTKWSNELQFTFGK